jgi:hypothetical protein
VIDASSMGDGDGMTTITTALPPIVVVKLSIRVVVANVTLLFVFRCCCPVGPLLPVAEAEAVVVVVVADSIISCLLLSKLCVVR